MAGIYIHIPFCKQACHYCDFHFSTNLKYKDAMIQALLQELDLRKNYLAEEFIDTIYFGGGTPSLMEEKDISAILKKIYQTYSLNSEPEVTLEANPDDLNAKNLKSFQEIGINRLSIGVQSFIQRDLEWMNRAHTSNEALDSIKRAQDIGLENISIDLIYGIPGLNDKEWKENIQQAIELEIKHISSYALTVEKGTALGNWVTKGRIKSPDEEQAAAQFEILMEVMENNQYQHYEISNFCIDGYHSRHNSSYWEGKKYLGIGPSAHSFNKNSRQWNINNNHQYIDQLDRGILPSIQEELSLENQLNEYVMISLRTNKGINLNYVRDEFGSEMLEKIEKNLSSYIEQNLLSLENNFCRTTKAGKLMADKIASDLFILENDH